MYGKNLLGSGLWRSIFCIEYIFVKFESYKIRWYSLFFTVSKGKACVQRVGSIAFLGMGGSVALYIIQNLWRDFASIITTYTWLVAAYFITAAIVSFAICYYRGPIHDIRAQNLVRWALRAVACLLVYAGSQIPEVSVAVILCLFMASWFPVQVLGGFGTLWRVDFCY